MSNVSFPPEVLENILSHLPVKSLLQYRSVSKFLRAIIDSPYFIHLHSKRSMKTDKALAYFRGVGSSNFICSLYMDPDPSCVKMETPFNIADFHLIIGSCNGFIGFSTGRVDREIIFWNPSTRKHIPIPTPKHNPHIVSDQIGYDHVNDDYKVVRLSMVSVPGGDVKFTVYSMRLNAWRIVEHDLPNNLIPVCCRVEYGLPNNIRGCCSGQVVCVSGVINYLVNQRSGPGLDCVIVAFDLASQSFHLVSLPECCNSYKALHLGLLGGCVCLVGNIGMFGVDVWVMAEYGVKESWKKLIAWTLTGSARHYKPYVNPIISLKNGREVLFKVGQQHFVRYDVEDKEAKETWMCNPSCLYTFLYSESLV